MSNLLKPKKKKSALFPQPMLKLPIKRRETTANAFIVESNNSMRMMSRDGRLTEALRILNAMNESVAYSDYGYLLRGCINNKALPAGKLVHAHITQRGLEIDTFLGTEIVTMYLKCGNLVDARRIFDQIPERNVVLWTAMIAGYARHGFGREALALFFQMQQMGVQPNQFTFAGVLPACVTLGSLEQGKEIHQEIIRNGFESHVFVGAALVNMYAKCGSLESARHVFDKIPQRNVVTWTTMVAGYAHNGHADEALELFDSMPERNVVSWNAMIAGYARNGYGEEALRLFHRMQLDGVKPNSNTFSCVLPVCASLGSLQQGRKVHEEIIASGLQSDVFVGSALVDMYAKCGDIHSARNLFDKMQSQDMVLWNAMIAGYVQNGNVDEAVELFEKMPERNVTSWNIVIAGYAQKGYIAEAVKLFQKMPERDVVSWNGMIAGYVQNGLVEEAMDIFLKMPEPNEVTWSTMIAGYAQNGFLTKALKLFNEMPEKNLASWNSMIAGYAQNGYMDEALKFFMTMPKQNLVSWTTMIVGYAQNGHIDEALKFFQKIPQRDVVSWNAIIAGYAQNGHGEEALKFFCQMQMEGLKANSKTFASVLSACASLTCLEQGQSIHEDIIRSGFQSDVCLGNALIDMYAKCGSIEHGRAVFDKMRQRDVISWNVMIAGYQQKGHVDEALDLFQKMPERDIISTNTMIAGYAQNGFVNDALKLFQEMPEQNVVSWNTIIAAYAHNGLGEEALKLCKQMQLEGVKPNLQTFASILSACANLASMAQGKEIHEQIIRSGYHSDVFVGSALVDMYAKCGSIENARFVFDGMDERNVVSWNAMIVGYALHGCSREGLDIFEQMQRTNVKPDKVTLVGILSACCHAGLVDVGWQYFDQISQYYRITPTMEHYGCMVDLLGRAGHLDEAKDLINKMPIKPDATVWGCLLGACRIHNNIELGELVAECLFELDPDNAAHYVLLSNIYAASRRWDSLEKVRKIMKDKMIQKKPGCSWIEVNGQVHSFISGNRSPPEEEKIYGKLDTLSRQMKSSGYVPDMISAE